MGISFISSEKCPANSPDLKPLDYFYWNELEKQMVGKKSTSRDGLIKKIKESMKKISIKTILRSILNFPRRIAERESQHGGRITNEYN
jgi:hypothetical protein